MVKGEDTWRVELELGNLPEKAKNVEMSKLNRNT